MLSRLFKFLLNDPFCFSLGQSREINQIKADLKQCALTESDVNVCLLELAKRIKPYMKSGIPELNIPQADPLLIDRSSVVRMI